MYDIDRKTASRLLKVSVRTVDRYISLNKLDTERREGRIWLDKKAILNLRVMRKREADVDMSTPKMSIDNIDVVPVDMSIDTEGNPIHSSESGDESRGRSKDETVSRTSRESEEMVYKKLFEKLQEDVKEKQGRLEMANYRVGQLEARIKDTIPLLEYNRDMTVERSEKDKLRKDLDSQVVQLENLIKTLKDEKFNRRIYLILLFILLLLQPLWFFYPFHQ